MNVNPSQILLFYIILVYKLAAIKYRVIFAAHETQATSKTHKFSHNQPQQLLEHPGRTGTV